MTYSVITLALGEESVNRLLLALAVTFLSGCNYERTKALQTNSEPPKTWFATLHSTVIGPKCVGCHNPKSLAGNIDLSDYDALMAGGRVVKGNCESSPLYQSVKMQRMPKGPNKLTAQELASLGAWIDAGASDTAPNPDKPLPPPIVEPPIPLAANYRSIKKNIIDLRCLGCHSGPKPKGELDLSTYKKMTSKLGTVTPEDPDDSTFYRLLVTDDEKKRMPPRRPPIPDAEIKVVKAWILAGAKETEE